MAKENKRVTTTNKDGGAQGFEGDGIEGKKDSDEKDGPEAAPQADPEQTTPEPPAADAKPLEEIKPTEPEASVEEKPVDRAAILKEMKAEDERLTKEEDAKKIMDGEMAMARISRREAIDRLESELKKG